MAASGVQGVVIALLDGIQLLDMAGPVEVFEAANHYTGREVYGAYRDRFHATGILSAL